MNIQLPTGKTITVSTYEYLFLLKDEDMEEFYQQCMADNLGVYVENPFSNKISKGRIEMEDLPEDTTEEDIKD